MTATVADDMGVPVLRAGPARRVVSLVPSLTESIAATRPEALVGATDWCTHPADLDVPRVRGTKNPNIAAILALQPDIVLANKEENRRTDVEKLRAAGQAVWVTVIETVEQALVSLRQMFDHALDWPAPAWLDHADLAWSQPAPIRQLRVAIPVWRDPWMVVGSSTFTGDLGARCGLTNVFEHHPDRYPHLSLDEIRAAQPEVIVLPDEPYAFTAGDGPEAFPELPSVLVDGRGLTWYGPSLVQARENLIAAVDRQLR